MSHALRPEGPVVIRPIIILRDEMTNVFNVTTQSHTVMKTSQVEEYAKQCGMQVVHITDGELKEACLEYLNSELYAGRRDQ